MRAVAAGCGRRRGSCRAGNQAASFSKSTRRRLNKYLRDSVSVGNSKEPCSGARRLTRRPHPPPLGRALTASAVTRRTELGALARRTPVPVARFTAAQTVAFPSVPAGVVRSLSATNVPDVASTAAQRDTSLSGCAASVDEGGRRHPPGGEPPPRPLPAVVGAAFATAVAALAAHTRRSPRPRTPSSPPRRPHGRPPWPLPHQVRHGPRRCVDKLWLRCKRCGWGGEGAEAEGAVERHTRGTCWNASSARGGGYRPTKPPTKPPCGPGCPPPHPRFGQPPMRCVMGGPSGEGGNATGRGRSPALPPCHALLLPMRAGGCGANSSFGDAPVSFRRAVHAARRHGLMRSARASRYPQPPAVARRIAPCPSLPPPPPPKLSPGPWSSYTATEAAVAAAPTVGCSHTRLRLPPLWTTSIRFADGRTN